MNTLLLNYLVSLTILPAAIIGSLRYPSLNKADRPIIWLWISIVLNETIRYVSILQGNYSLLGYNLWILLAGLLYALQFYRWRVITSITWLVSILAAMLLLWTIDHFLLQGSTIHRRQPYFRLALALFIVVMAVTYINRLIVRERTSLLTNAHFLLCVALAVYYTFRVLCDAFSLQGMSPDFLNRLSNFNRYILQFMYLVFLFAAIWMPKRKNFILPLS